MCSCARRSVRASERASVRVYAFAHHIVHPNARTPHCCARPLTRRPGAAGAQLYVHGDYAVRSHARCASRTHACHCKPEHTRAQTHTPMRARARALTRTSKRSHRRLHTRTHSQTHTRAQLRPRACTRPHTCSRTHTRAHTHTHPHTRSHTRARACTHERTHAHTDVRTPRYTAFDLSCAKLCAHAHEELSLQQV
jgi:hypothetical protein